MGITSAERKAYMRGYMRERRARLKKRPVGRPRKALSQHSLDPKQFIYVVTDTYTPDRWGEAFEVLADRCRSRSAPTTNPEAYLRKYLKKHMQSRWRAERDRQALHEQDLLDWQTSKLNPKFTEFRFN